MVITFNPKEALASIANIFVVACLQSHGMSLDAATEIGAITEGAIKGVGIKKSPKKLHSNVYDKLEKAIKQSISLAIQSSVVSHLPDDFINVIFDSAFSFNSIRVYLSADNPVMALEEVLKASLTSSDIYDVDAIPIDQIAVDIINNIDESIQSDSELAVLATYYKVSEISSILFDYFSSNEHLKLDDFFESYGQAAKRQYEELTHDGNKFHNLNIITDIFPEASVCELDFNGLDENNEILQLMEFVEQYDFENLLLLGEGGIGKTTILFYILQSYYNGSAKFPQIPLYIELNRCPSNLDSWCIDDKNSIFIEKYIAGLLLGRKNVGKDNEFIDKIQYEFQKEPPKGIPQYMVLLDGLNEVASGTSTGYSIRTILESEIAQDLQKYRNVRFIITSRNNSRKIKGVKRINILGVSKEGIEAYLRAEEEKGNIKKGVTDKVLKSDELLDCLRIPLFLNMFGVVSGDTTISTRGEILREFFYKKRSNLYSSKIEGEKINGFILDFIVPEIAWEMTQKDTFTISFTEVQKIVDKILLNEKESMALNRYSQKCFDYIEPPSYLCGVVLSMFNERQRTIGILDIMVESLAIVYGDDGGYRFKHHHFRDYFSALFIINEIKLGTCLFDNIGNEWSYLENIKKYKLHKDTIQFISESIGLHHSNPTYTPDKKWTMRKWDENNGIIRILLNVYRECFDNSNGWSVWNIVQILNYSGMGLLGIDLSDLDLRNINFNGILCGIGTNSSELATKFDNSIIDLNYFLPIGHHETMVDVKYSSNGIYILTVSDSRMIIWNSDYEYVNKIDINKKISKAIFSGDSNNVVFYTEDFEIRIWNLWDGEEYILNESQFEICDLCSGDSDNCVYIGYRNGNIKKLNIPDHKWIKRTLRVGQTISQIMFDKKYGHIVVKTENGQIFYGDELHNNFRNLPYSKIKQVTLAQNGEKYGFVTMDNCIEVGDLYGEQLQCVNCNCENVSFIQLSPDGRYLAIVEDKLTLQIVDLNTNKYNRPIQCSLEITSVSFSDNNRYIISTAGDRFAKVWEVKSDVGVCIRPLGDIADWIRNAYYSPDGKLIATSSIDTTGKIWDAQNGVLVNLLFGHEDRVTSISFDNTGAIAVTTSDDCTAKIWKTKESGCIRTLKNNDNSVHNAAFDKDNKRLATASWDKTASIWNLEDEEKEPKILIGHEAPVLTVMFDTSNNNVITASNDNTAILWDANTGEEKGIRVAHTDRLNNAAFSPNGEFIITSSFDKTAKIWTQNGELVKSLEGHKDSVRSAVFSPDGNHIVTVSRDTTGKLWDGHTFEYCNDLIGHTFFVRSAMFDGNSDKLVTASYDGSIREWNLNGECVNIIHSIPGLFVSGCDFRNLNPLCSITEEQRKIFKTHGAIIDAINKFERQNVGEQQREEIASAKAKRKHAGRKRIEVPDIQTHYRRYQCQQVSKTQLARELHISRSTLDRLFDELEHPRKNE